MPQPIMRHIARRAMQVAIAAAGILVVLLVFSRQAHAATLAPSAAPAPSVSSAPAVPAPGDLQRKSLRKGFVCVFRPADEGHLEPGSGLSRW